MSPDSSSSGISAPAGLSARWASLANDEQRLVVTVADEGIGVPPAERAVIFQPFVRGGNVGTIGGMGIGLYITKRHVELLGGRIELLPTERGTAFQVEIPLGGSATGSRG